MLWTGAEILDWYRTQVPVGWCNGASVAAEADRKLIMSNPGHAGLPLSYGFLGLQSRSGS